MHDCRARSLPRAGCGRVCPLRLQHFTAGAVRLALARGILLAVGLGCGYVGAQMYRELPASALAFIIGFGVVHLPATGILFLKAQRGEQPS